ncbi:MULTISPECIES: DUF4336 domain-containing protein [Methylomonas]|uniref:DUF4336 domain-containing protein n=2 Tax=Methylomonas TaxID=416 RepID=A0A126T725_9GAMM|nr:MULTISPECIES: DUF4336 domain-containing protein [Methylomonas]AMK77872.1 hypothetical protein JT25_015540 [Methylomonas denitrificans]OAI04533.1 hypothetical protein A1342_13735 [Methylomonas methanica]TCV87044.1 uncharacterized protein DUF4336 [Methylomonas methanica]
MVLKTLVPGQIWYAQQTIKFGPLNLSTRATFVKLLDGSLWVHSPINPSPQLVAEIAEIGPVHYVVAPNKSHHLFFTPFVKTFPNAQGYIAPGLTDKRPDLSSYPELSQLEKLTWATELNPIFVEGLPIINETVWFHSATGTLILTDLLFCFGTEHAGLARMAAKLLGVYDRLAMSRTMKLLVKDKTALARTADALLALDIERVVLAHDQIIEHDAKRKLSAAFNWLRK